MTTQANCQRCGDAFTKYATEHSPGYARTTDNTYICYKCCGVLDEKHMNDKGAIMLYFTYNSPCNNSQFTRSGINLTASDYKVSNWPSSLTFKPLKVRVGKHNIAGRRWDVWFVQGGYVWHGVQYGDNTDILHCKRTKERSCKECGNPRGPKSHDEGCGAGNNHAQSWC